MSKKIYSRIITQNGYKYLDRIKVEDLYGKLFITAHSTLASNGKLVNTCSYQVGGIVADLIAGKGECPYILES